jgi:hypothetical protein
MTYSAGDDDVTGIEIDVLGLYSPEAAAVAAQGTACDPGSGPVRMDD